MERNTHNPSNWLCFLVASGFPGGSDCREIHLQCRRPGFDPWVGKIPWRKEWQPTPVFLPGESHGQRSLVDYSPWDCKESDTTEQLPYIQHCLSAGCRHYAFCDRSHGSCTITQGGRSNLQMETLRDRAVRSPPQGHPASV